ncbi:DNA mismatch repair endonuclease MutL [Picosynechococcus sp. NKBG042902]|uniref:DNA mismatch repair endonuclease MutL n=1 Tax=Picosynechococcus sp. NKBG042902 TaxID=490193 RepID=UPI0004AA75EF|nr:DNA mismatch repair endonuclease MutL [Picosynechococcus sp. NKBG042902]
MANIKQLPNDVIQLIAAGEVIDSLAAVVRELAENAIDAGATRINIDIQPQRWQIRVVDNGQGMDLEDLQQCALPHRTSKIGDRQDLAHIKSLGFRGEALHSIAQVAKLTIASCQDRQPGYQLTVQQNHFSEPLLKPMAVGTMVTVTDIFQNFPVRRHALPAIAQQLKTAQQIIYHLALCQPQITWQVTQNNQPWFAISAGKNAQDILPQLLKSINIQDLIYRCYQAADFLTEYQPSFVTSYLELILGLPDRCHRHQADWLKLGINGRIVRFSALEQVMMKAFSRTLPRDRHPVCFVHLHVPPEQIDWNRHPAKSEIYLQNQALWQEVIPKAIAKSLSFSEVSLPRIENQRILNLIQAAEKSENYSLKSLEKQTDISSENPLKKSLKVIGQARNTYILVEHTEGIWLVEQHIADERAIYEDLHKNWQLVSLSQPILLNHLSPKQIEQLTENIGLELEVFGENIWRVNTIPSALQDNPDLEAALLELSLGGDLDAAQVAIACRTAVRNGTPLDFPTMQTIIDRWQRCKNPSTCPHGRPIYLALEETSLYRFFRRHWVLGKSHGITEK